MKRLAVVVLTLAVILSAAPVLVAAVTVAALLNDTSTAAAPGTTSLVAPRIPATMLVAYQRAATVCPGLPWTVLAAIGTVESDNGQSSLPGVASGRNPLGAEGPMQFEPATFAPYSRPVPAGGADPPTPYDSLDAAYAAARLLCANGGALANHLRQAVFAYNHSETYVTAVLQLAATLASAVPAPAPAARVAAEYALGQIGIPYRWGAESPGVAFDCSGLVQAAWAAAGVRLPRVAQDQFDVGPRLAGGTPLQPGDLVFFGSPGAGVTHVGVVIDSGGLMVDAPHTGAAVRVESFPLTVGSAWGGDIYVGATRPGGT